MKISGNSTQLPDVKEAYLRQAVEKPQAEKTAQQQRDDSVKISSRAKEVQKITSDVKKAPDVREEKVRQVKDQLATGTYNVRGEAVAGKMLKESMLGTIL